MFRRRRRTVVVCCVFPGYFRCCRVWRGVGSIVSPVSITVFIVVGVSSSGPWSQRSSDVSSSHNSRNKLQILNLQMEKSDLRILGIRTKDLRAHKMGKSFVASVIIN